MRDPEARELPRRVEDRVEVQHRFTHSHEDRVVDRFGAPEMERLVEDLG